MVVGRQGSKRLFGESAVEVKTVGVFFFAGHGIQSSGKNLLIPVYFVVPESMGSDPASLAAMETIVRKRSVELDEVMSNMSDCRLFCAVMLLDCCRTQPQFMRSLSRGDGTTRGGLATVSAHSMQADGGTLIAFATAPGQVAKDSSRLNPKHSPFTAALVSRLESDGADVPLFQLFMRVTSDVLIDTSDEQEPWLQTSLRTSAETLRLGGKMGSKTPQSLGGNNSSAPAEDAPSLSLCETLAKWKLDEYLEPLQALGVTEAADLADVAADEEMLQQVPFKPLHLKKFKSIAIGTTSPALPVADMAELTALRKEVEKLRSERNSDSTGIDAGAFSLKASLGWQQESVPRSHLSLHVEPLSARAWAHEKSLAHMGDDTVFMIDCTLGLAKGITRDEAEGVLRVLQTFCDVAIAEISSHEPSFADGSPTLELHLVNDGEDAEKMAIAINFHMLSAEIFFRTASSSEISLFEWIFNGKLTKECLQAFEQLGVDKLPSLDLSIDLGFTVSDLVALGPTPVALSSVLAARAKFSAFPARWLAFIHPESQNEKGLRARHMDGSLMKLLALLSSLGVTCDFESLGDWRLHTLLSDSERTALSSFTGFDLRKEMEKIDADPYQVLQIDSSGNKELDDALRSVVKMILGRNAMVTGLTGFSFICPSFRLALEQAEQSTTRQVPISFRDMMVLGLAIGPRL
jgi:hypothetical protein